MEHLFHILEELLSNSFITSARYCLNSMPISRVLSKVGLALDPYGKIDALLRMIQFMVHLPEAWAYWGFVSTMKHWHVKTTSKFAEALISNKDRYSAIFKDIKVADSFIQYQHWLCQFLTLDCPALQMQLLMVSVSKSILLTLLWTLL